MIPARPVLLDTTVLSNFAQIRRPELAMRVWQGRACTTQEAPEEFLTGAAGGARPADAWGTLPVVRLIERERATAAGLPAGLGPGERSCLAVAMHRRGLLATDDRDARTTARRLGVRLSGTVGILTLAVDGGHLSSGEANALLAAMIAAGYHAPVSQLDELPTE